MERLTRKEIAKTATDKPIAMIRPFLGAFVEAVSLGLVAYEVIDVASLSSLKAGLAEIMIGVWGYHYSNT